MQSKGYNEMLKPPGACPHGGGPVNYTAGVVGWRKAHVSGGSKPATRARGFSGPWAVKPLWKESPDRERQQLEATGAQGARHRRQQDHPPHGRDAAGEGGLRGVHGGRWLRCARQDRRSSARHRVRRHHDAAAGRLPDLLAHQTQQGVPLHTRDHVVLQGWSVRPGARSHRRVRALPHQALYQGRAALRDRDAYREMIAMALVLIVDDSPPAPAFLGRWWSWL